MREHADRHVDEEDPAPAELLGDARRRRAARSRARAPRRRPRCPIAVPRCRGGNVAVMIESVAGFISAAPTPCTTRAPISMAAPLGEPAGERRGGEDHEADHEDPAPAEQVGELAAGEHEGAEGERVAGDDPLELARSAGSATVWIDGSATFTTVLSSMIMNSPNETAASVHHLRCSSSTKLARIFARTLVETNSGRVAAVAEVVWAPGRGDARARERRPADAPARLRELPRARRALDRRPGVVLAGGRRGPRASSSSSPGSRSSTSRAAPSGRPGSSAGS